MNARHRTRRMRLALLTAIIALCVYIYEAAPWQAVDTEPPQSDEETVVPDTALSALDDIAVAGRAPRTGYSRDQFGPGWQTITGCDTRNIILNRDLENVALDDQCRVVSGRLDDPYTGQRIEFSRGAGSADVQIDHVVALSNAWQTGAQNLNYDERVAFSNDPLNLLAVDGTSNQAKGDADAATWLPPYRAFRCQYVARQTAIKLKYDLWMTTGEKRAITSILQRCPDQRLPAGALAPRL